MTQKELSYFEDAIGHVGNIIKICQESVKNMQDEKLVSFIQNELSKHQNLKQTLMGKLEAKARG